MSETNLFSRREFARSTALVACSLAAAKAPLALSTSLDEASPLRLGLASYTFRNFTRAQLIGFMKQLNVFDLNAKDVKDHLPSDSAGEAQALAGYEAAGVRLHAAGVIYFDKNDDHDIRAKFEYCRRAGVRVIAAGPSPETLPRMQDLVKEYDIRIAIHNHG